MLTPEEKKKGARTGRDTHLPAVGHLGIERGDYSPKVWLVMDRIRAATEPPARRCRDVLAEYVARHPGTSEFDLLCEFTDLGGVSVSEILEWFLEGKAAVSDSAMQRMLGDMEP